MPTRLDRAAEVIVVGCGPAGLTAAVALASGGVPTLLVGERPANSDNRTTALLAGSVNALQALGVWNHCEPNAAPLRAMRLVDDTGRLLRAPEVKFDAHEIGLDVFGYNIENRLLVDALMHHAATLPALELRQQRVVAVEPNSRDINIRLADDNNISARLVIGADGRKSSCREAAGIGVDTRTYPQAALTIIFSHSRPHHDTSTEFHTANGPFTIVPLPGRRSSLVWVMQPHDAEAMTTLNDAELSTEIERRSHSILGKVTVEPGRGFFPLSTTQARSFVSRRVALVGEAAHLIPPIGAQGLNLGLRDAATISEIVVQARLDGRDPGGADLLETYDRMRRADVGSRSAAVDLLNRSLLTNFLPVQATRGVGLYALDRIGPLRRAVMREGVAPASRQPRLM